MTNAAEVKTFILKECGEDWRNAVRRLSFLAHSLGHGERSRLQLLFNLAGAEKACICVGCSIFVVKGV